MAEINSLTIPLKIEITGNDKVEKEVSKLADTLTKSVERVISTFQEYRWEFVAKNIFVK